MPTPDQTTTELSAAVHSRVVAALTPKRTRVLIAEDDLVSAKVLSALLQRLGYDVVSARDGDEAWQLFKAEPTRLIVSDWMMPGTDGLALCEKVRGLHDLPYTYFILLTANRTTAENYASRLRPALMTFSPSPSTAMRCRCGYAWRRES
jgi:CheY-like chemotaxis protein